ncbi:MAG: hypothetical protein H7Z14_05155, partial [Anaerolineae bacterium]|nr:hypothetical protein [Phycisphaerae bacterium]
MIRYLTRFVFLLLVLLSLSHVTAAIPGADDPNAYTRWTMQRDLLEFNRRTTVEAYKQFGHRDPKWDAKAIELLEGTAKHLTEGKLPAGYRSLNPTFVETAALAQAVVTAGCDDPLVLDMIAINFDDTGKDAQARDAVRRAFTAFAEQQNKHPILRQMNNARRARKLTRQTEEKDLYAKFDDRLYALSVLAVTSNETRGIDRRFLYDMILEDVWKNWKPERAQQFIDAISADKNSDPWLVKMFSGKYFIRAAWAARGTGFADTVTDEGWKGMTDGLNRAQENLSAAWKLEPKFPEPASAMITVAMGGGAAPDETERLWFDRAVAAQLDYSEAYDNLGYSMLPRWGGSYEQIIQFGIECAATKRYDTDVPYTYVESLNRVRNDGAGWDIWRVRGMFERAGDILLGYAKWTPPTGRSMQNWNYSALAGYAWQVGRYDVARDALNNMKGQWDRNGLDSSGVYLPLRTISGIYALSGDLAKDLLAAEQSAAFDRHDDATAAYEKAAAGPKNDDPAARWVRGRAHELRQLAAFHRGESVDLMPTDAELTGYESLGGQWTLEQNGDERSIVGSSQNSNLRLLCATRFGPRYELLVTMELLDAGTVSDPGVGVFYGAVEANKFHAIWVHPKTTRVRMRFDANGKFPNWPVKEVDRKINLLKLRVWDDHAEFYING